MEGGCIGMVNLSNKLREKVKSYKLSKKEVLQITDDTYLIVFEGKSFDFDCGQFCMIDVDSYGLTRKPFTLGKFEGNLAISVKIVGEGTRYIVETKELIDILAPLGNPFIPEETERTKGKSGAVVVASSCFAEGYFIYQKFNVPLYVTSKIPFSESFVERFRNENIEFIVNDSEFLRLMKRINDSEFEWVFVSGSRNMEKIAVKNLYKKIVYISLNEYMGCGIGACKSCAVESKHGIKHVCTDGPVFRGDEVCL